MCLSMVGIFIVIKINAPAGTAAFAGFHGRGDDLAYGGNLTLPGEIVKGYSFGIVRINIDKVAGFCIKHAGGLIGSDFDNILTAKIFGRNIMDLFA